MYRCIEHGVDMAKIRAVSSWLLLLVAQHKKHLEVYDHAIMSDITLNKMV